MRILVRQYYMDFCCEEERFEILSHKSYKIYIAHE